MHEGYPNIVILDVSKAVSRKWCKIGSKLILITNRKSYMSFQLEPKSVTLNDLERHNGPCVISQNFCVRYRRKTIKAEFSIQTTFPVKIFLVVLVTTTG